MIKQGRNHVLLVAAAAMLGPVAFVGQPAFAQPAPATTPDPAAVAALVAALNAALDAQARNATSQSVEAALAFVIDQSGQPSDVILAALAALDLKARTTTVMTAVASLMQKVRAGTALAGTGGVGGVGGAGPTNLGAGPTVGGGGSGSDYTAAP
jgi:hypothetical protein